ncbi:hypothetical protein BC829DRAFT_494000 [Chytridium lagenaria]|nr:hypothetical protein BC829DRAFT_494000 [Chytridium lagenaria]
MDIAIFRSMVGFRIRNSIMAETEVTTDIPEHSDLTPKDYWDQRSRGLGMYIHSPLAPRNPDPPSLAAKKIFSAPLPIAMQANASFSTSSHTASQMFGANFVYPGFQSRLDQAYADARSKGLWSNTYAAENPFEYWAEGAQGYFNCNARSIPSNGIHGEIYNKEQLRFYDPTLFGLLDEVFKGASYVYSCDPKPACANVTTTTSEPTASTSATSTLTTGAVTSTIVPTGSITSTISGGDGGDGVVGVVAEMVTSTTPNGPSTSSINIITSGGVASKSTFTLVMGGLVVALLF